MGHHSASLSVTRPWVRAAMGAAVGTTLLVVTPAGSAGALSLPGIEGIPSISIGSQPTPPSSYTTIREAAPGQPTVVIVGGTDDQDSMQQLARLQSVLPPGVGIKTVTSPQSVGAGWDNLLVVGTGAYTYQQSVDAGVAAAKAAILASDGATPISVVGYSQGATIVETAIKQLATEGTLPPGTTVAVFADPNTPYTGLANLMPAFVPGLPQKPVDVTNMPVPTTITNINQDTWGANVSSNPLVALFYIAPGAIIHGKAYSAEELERWKDTGKVTQIGDNTTLIVLHPKTAGGNDINPWFYAYDLLAREYGLPQLEGPVYETLNQVLNLAVPLGESGQPTTIGGVRIPTVNELTQPLAGLGTVLGGGMSPTSIPQLGTLLAEQSTERTQPSPVPPTTVPTPEPVIEAPETPVQPEAAPEVVDPPTVAPIVAPVEPPKETVSSGDTSGQTVDETPTQVTPEPTGSPSDGVSGGNTSTPPEESSGSETATDSSSSISDPSSTSADAPSGETAPDAGDSGTTSNGGAGSDE